MIRSALLVSGHGRGRTYRVAPGPAREPLLQLGITTVSLVRGLGVVGRAAAALEFVAVTSSEIVAVTSPNASVSDTARAQLILSALAQVHRRVLRLLEHDELRRHRDDGDRYRRALAEADIVVGELARSFPRPIPLPRRIGTPLGDVSPALPRPSRRALQRVGAGFRITHAAIFGSAVRDDFGDDSDVDVVVAYAPGGGTSLRQAMALEEELERLFGRDVDVLNRAYLHPALAERIEAEAVPIIGA